VSPLSKSNYDVLAAVLRLWYSEEQILEIWDLLKDYDDQLMPSSKKITDDKKWKLNKFTMHEDVYVEE
jgi:hypothetical protein